MVAEHCVIWGILRRGSSTALARKRSRYRVLLVVTSGQFITKLTMLTWHRVEARDEI